ncbi:ATP-binding protein [Saccharopolyspora sp. CA-218241]|uniref:ATP-binding protein n=1 Tax=Saccharopolyspora sp. CA-218241 TaxID=3240027 RepID=UPI003D992942
MVSTARSRDGELSGSFPADVTSFVGRRREITLTKRLLAESRVVTLTGPGGVGKTRLALRVAGGMRRQFRDKARLVELEDVEEDDLVVDAVVEQLGLGGPTTADLDAVLEHLRDREMLLVLDNCEHVVDAAARVVDAVTRWCPAVRVLATSRQSLGVAGEATLVVPPLQTPDPEHLPPPEAYEQYASVRLFVERARAAVPEFEVTQDNAPALMRLSHHLDGNPLAIELAAVRLRSLSLTQLEERLARRTDLLTDGRRGAPARQQSLRALIDWSWELCGEQERVAWSRVSVFSGSFDLPAAAYVTGRGAGEAGVLDALHALVDKSVLVREEEGGEVRFRLPHALREYGHDKLAALGEQDPMKQRHRLYYADLVDRFAADWIGERQVEWVHRLRREHGNVRLALHTSLSSAETASTALRMATGLGQYWGIRGLNGEGRHWLDQALEIAPNDDPERAAALRYDAWLALLLGDVEAAMPMLEQAGVLATRRGDEAEKAAIALVRGLGSLILGRLEQADGLVTDALERSRAQGSVVGELFALFALGLVRGLGEEPDSGLALLNECIAITAGYGELFWRAYALWALAQVAIRQDAAERAENAAKEALRLQRELDNRLALAFTLDTLAWTAQRQARAERAARLFGAAAALWDSVGASPAFYTPFSATHAEHAQQTRQMLGEETFQDSFDRGRRLSLPGAVEFALEAKKQPRQAREDDNVHPMPLTRRERQIAELVAQGNTNKEIAEGLVIAQRTVEGHVQNILSKLDFSSRAQIGGWVAGQKQGDAADSGS